MRKLRLGAATYLWRVSHRHAPPRCTELFTAYLEDHPRAPLRVLFPESESRGREYVGRAGLIGEYAHDGAWLNLNLPGTARKLIEAALAAGWNPLQPGAFELDGWALL